MPLSQPDSGNVFEKIPLEFFEKSSDASKRVADEIASLIRTKNELKEKCVLGLATGSSPIKVYEELVRLHQEEGLSFQNVITFNLDEYYPIAPNALQSYVRFMKEHLFDHVDIQTENIHIPDGTLEKKGVTDYCLEYDRQIEALGGLDLQILGIGRTGHIGFNEPGSHIESRTRLITLDHITRQDAASDFFGEEYVPRNAITMGVRTIMKAKRILLMAWGENKAPIIKQTVEGEITAHVPATYLQQHPNCLFVTDEAAAQHLTRFSKPWLVQNVLDWTPYLIKKAVINLCETLNKPILKLTDRDYNDHGLSDLLAQHGSAYQINIQVFNELQHTLTGWPGGKPNADDTQRPERNTPEKKRVVIFSPHPDDDVISMGGTFARLHDQGHDVHVVYQTSGNIAVFDDDVIRYADFVTEYHESFGFKTEKAEELFTTIRQQIADKKPGETDSIEVQKIKALIRRAEARAGARYIGLSDDHIHFMDLPFYETGTVKKKPFGIEDIEITKAFLEEVQPHQIYAAGDLSDPHGTHRVCLEIIKESLEEVKNQKWIKDCWVWLYRGAWQEWEMENIEMAVPLSPDELLRKRRAIFKHQSQKDRPLFPGSDSREFWQRAEERNRATAENYNRLGLAEYEAIEAFKKWKL